MAGTSATPPPDPGPVLSRAQGWLGVVYPVMEKSTPVTLLAVVVLGGILIWGLWREVGRVQDLNREVVERLLAERQAHVEWLKERVHCGPGPQPGDGR